MSRLLVPWIACLALAAAHAQAPAPVASPATAPAKPAPSSCPVDIPTEARLVARLHELLEMRPADSTSQARIKLELMDRLRDVIVRFPGNEFTAQAVNFYVKLNHISNQNEDTQVLARTRLEEASTPDQAYVATLLLLNLGAATRDYDSALEQLAKKARTAPALMTAPRVQLLLGAIHLAAEKWSDAVRVIEAVPADKVAGAEQKNRSLLLSRAYRQLAETQPDPAALGSRTRAMALLESVIAEGVKEKKPEVEFATVLLDAAALSESLGNKQRGVSLCHKVEELFRGRSEALTADTMAFRMEREGTPAPEFQGPDLDGKQVALKDFRGRIVLLDFWFTRCGPCKTDLLPLRTMVNRLAGKPFSLISISVDAPGKLTEVKNYVRENQITWNQIYEGLGSQSVIAKQFHAITAPFYCVIDEHGVIKKLGPRGRAVEDAVKAELARMEEGGKGASPAPPSPSPSH